MLSIVVILLVVSVSICLALLFLGFVDVAFRRQRVSEPSEQVTKLSRSERESQDFTPGMADPLESRDPPVPSQSGGDVIDRAYLLDEQAIRAETDPSRIA
jgi:hypothetical protein